jgi:hypothetical protein
MTEPSHVYAPPSPQELDRIVRLYRLEPWQRELLETFLRKDEEGWRERESYRQRAQALFDEVVRNMDEILGLTEEGYRA